MGKWTLWEKITLKFKQMFCKHSVHTAVKVHECDKHIGYEVWCERCHKSMQLVYYQK